MSTRLEYRSARVFEDLGLEALGKIEDEEREDEGDRVVTRRKIRVRIL